MKSILVPFAQQGHSIENFRVLTVQQEDSIKTKWERRNAKNAVLELTSQWIVNPVVQQVIAVHVHTVPYPMKPLAIVLANAFTAFTGWIVLDLAHHAQPMGWFVSTIPRF
ncbi:PREDICTED: uncharacterized protein LOC107344180 [Acropora digitifera]|uniref:uncharacterized protein LOC107344180 n=1 Tax=Acropora digitifera TaxID=70779 RepID=UPI00077AEE28|nr:PREDICTED: uncharacterized protein LOC107344180 [Acropora digitifera]